MRDAIIAFLSIGMLVSGCTAAIQGKMFGCKQNPASVYCPK
jgi:hypothetical protein